MVRLSEVSLQCKLKYFPSTSPQPRYRCPILVSVSVHPQSKRKTEGRVAKVTWERPSLQRRCRQGERSLAARLNLHRGASAHHGEVWHHLRSHTGKYQKPSTRNSEELLWETNIKIWTKSISVLKSWTHFKTFDTFYWHWSGQFGLAFKMLKLYLGLDRMDFSDWM